MKAIRFEGVGGPDVLRLVEEPMPELRPDDLLVRVHAAGVNRADILQRKGFYGERPDFGDSLIPGLEMAGEVVEVGARATGFKPGARVMAVVGGGGYAEYARAHHRMCMPIPDSLTYVQAAAIPEAFVTAHEALVHLGKAKSGDWVLVHAAAGGVGSAAVALAHAIGAKIIYTASGEKRIARVAELGGTVGVDYRKEDFFDAVMKATGGLGVNAVIDFIGGPYLDRNLRSLADGGRLIEVGLLGGREGVLPVDLLLQKYLRIIGTVMKSRPFEEKAAMTSRFRDRWLASFAAGTLAPIVDRTFALDHAADAHRAMEASGNFGKIILSIR
ncbi:MAG: NAD(P)H-quinone oxidoreductase [Acidobacteriaceae bacterium]